MCWIRTAQPSGGKLFLGGGLYPTMWSTIYINQCPSNYNKVTIEREGVCPWLLECDFQRVLPFFHQCNCLTLHNYNYHDSVVKHPHLYRKLVETRNLQMNAAYSKCKSSDKFKNKPIIFQWNYGASYLSHWRHWQCCYYVAVVCGLFYHGKSYN